MSKIKIMPIDLANKIAAGEVIENQSSVVKELVENAIDASATKIDISLVDSGFQLIQVIDNGLGMSNDDLQLCFKQHATSKLTAQYDLFNISTLGFRGEALASIASISKVKVSTNDESSNGYNFDVFEDKVSEGYSNRGTKMSVYNLFYNVPARLKYLQSQRSELANITEIVARFALTYPQIAFSLVNDNKKIINTMGNNNLLQIISNIYSLDIAQNMEEIAFSNSDFEISGYIGNKFSTRSNKRAINIFINKRLVFNKDLENAIISGYGEYLMEKRYPIVVINIECDFQLIDVNVHPAKREVRISKLEELLSLLKEGIKDRFNIVKRQFISKPKHVQPQMEFSYSPLKVSEDTIKYPNNIIKEKNNVLENKVDIEIDTFKTEDMDEFISIKPDILTNHQERAVQPEFEKNIEEEIVEADVLNDYHKDTIDEVEDDLIQFDVIGQFDGTYIIVQNEKGLHLIDQHAAMERINYEKSLKEVAGKDLEFQELIVPIIIPLTLSEKMKVVALKKILSEIGINIEEQANHDLIVREIPLWVNQENANGYIQESVDYVLELKNVKVSDIKKEELIMASCKMSLKANKVLSINEQRKLVDELVHTSNYDHCPHGRPIIITFSKIDVEKMFKRIV